MSPGALHLGINGRFYGVKNVTGVQRFALEVTDRLAAHHQVTLFVPRNVQPDRLPRSVRAAYGRLAGHAWEQLELPRQAARAGCDLMLHMSGTAPVRRRGDVMVVHDVLPLTQPRFFSRRFTAWYRFVLRHALPRMAAVLTVSESSRREITRLFREAPAVIVVKQGLAPFDSPAAEADVHKALQELRIERPFLLAVSGGDPRKNLAFLNGVMRELGRRGANRPLIVTGSAPRRVHGRSGDPASPEVRFTGHVSDSVLRALYTAAETLCFPSLAEGFGRPPLEAAACGTPAVVANPTATVTGARTAGLAVRLDAAAWADAIEALARDVELHREVVRRGRDAGEGMNWDACAREVWDLCESAVSAPARENRAGSAQGAS